MQLRKYCKFKAASILKAVREGRTPEIGGPMVSVFDLLDSVCLTRDVHSFGFSLLKSAS